MILGGDLHAEPEPRSSLARPRLHSDSAPLAPGPLAAAAAGTGAGDDVASRRLSVPPTSVSAPLLSSAALFLDSKSGEMTASRAPIPHLQQLVDMGFEEVRDGLAKERSSIYLFAERTT